MTKRYVDRSGKDAEGDITKLCGAWGSTSKAQAIREIEASTYNYVVRLGGGEVKVLVKQGKTGKYLTTSPDGRTRNNLDDLPEC